MPVAQRFTTEYIDHEDRLRISASLPNEEVAVMWITRRLLDRLASHLAGLLEQETAQAPLPEVQQTFAQQAAVASHVQQSQEQEQVPVQAQQAQTVHEWLVLEVDVTPLEQGVLLRLRGSQAEQVVELGMPPVLLRQWLAIVHGQYMRAEWPLSAWPAWMNEAAQAPAAAENSGVILH
ncbi:hypothetical protein [Orrella daihaiensis]|uniref:Flagellar hook-length control protein FliK n=1 Tax=Orrella daihaiensis TaxID=2782176 RepID=A0ABY4AJA3_9BURK|nr:hypothetical protein [Orrella daihaiensis]UOD50372.1 hypothetical protein DHf2319_13260 [Orrella daihaiensis]